MGKTKKQTSKKVATDAAKILRDKSSSDIQKKLAGSALAQRNPIAGTSEEIDEKAAKVLQSPKYAEETKKLAASVLSQSNGVE